MVTNPISFNILAKHGLALAKKKEEAHLKAL
jgi:hypothetical protein